VGRLARRCGGLSSLAAVLLSSSPWDPRRQRRPGRQGRALRGLRTLVRLVGGDYGPG